MVSGKIRFNGKFLDPSILKRNDWELNADEKYEKGIFEHVKAKVHSEKSTDPRVRKYWEENKMDGLGYFDEPDVPVEEAKEKEGVYF